MHSTRIVPFVDVASRSPGVCNHHDQETRLGGGGVEGACLRSHRPTSSRRDHSSLVCHMHRMHTMHCGDEGKRKAKEDGMQGRWAPKMEGRQV